MLDRQQASAVRATPSHQRIDGVPKHADRGYRQKDGGQCRIGFGKHYPQQSADQADAYPYKANYSDFLHIVSSVLG